MYKKLLHRIKEVGEIQLMFAPWNLILAIFASASTSRRRTPAAVRKKGTVARGRQGGRHEAHNESREGAHRMAGAAA